MPYLAHKQHGFVFAPGLTEEAAKAGWVECDDVLKFKAMGYGSDDGDEMTPEQPDIEAPEVIKPRRGRKPNA